MLITQVGPDDGGTIKGIHLHASLIDIRLTWVAKPAPGSQADSGPSTAARRKVLTGWTHVHYNASSCIEIDTGPRSTGATPY